jgi:hypothetical protein
MHKEKRSKEPKDKLSLIKRFITGEDIAQEIIYNNIPRITGMIVIDSAKYLSKLSADQLNELRLIKNERERSKRLNEIIREKEGEVWCETKDYQPRMKVYPDPEIEGVHYDKPANVPVIEPEIPKIKNIEISVRSDKKKTEARKEPVNASPMKEEKHRQMLKQQLEALDKEQKEYAIQRAKRILNSQANQSYHEWLCSNLYR